MMRALLGLLLAGALAATAADPDADRGQKAFEKRCTGCHALDEVKVGPRLRGAFGRAAGKDEEFPYSDALKKARITWNEETLDKWLTDTESVAPDNDMSFRLNDAKERKAIIEYLKSLQAR